MENNFTRFIYNRSPTFLQNIYCSIIGYRVYKQRYGKVFFDTLNFLDKSQWWSRSELEEYQNQELRKLISHCYNTVPYYRKIFDELGLKPNHFKTKEDLKKLPVMTKDDIRNNFENLISKDRNFRGKLLKIHTSGSTLGGFHVYVCQETNDKWYAHAWRQRSWFGVSIKDNYASFHGRLVVPHSQNNPPFWRKNFFGKQTLFSVYHLKPEYINYYINELNRDYFKYYFGYPSSLYIIASFMAENNIVLNHYPSVIFTSSETLLEYQRSAIEKEFRVRVADRYGNSEMVSLMHECPEGNHHIDMEFGIIETESIGNSFEGKYGEMICTGFANYGMPLLRYRINDVIKTSEKECPCGRSSLIVEEIIGRIEDFIVLANGSVIGRIDHVFKDMVNVKESQIVQEKPGEIIIKIVRYPAYSAADERNLLKEFHLRLGNDFMVNFEYVDSIPRGKNGKFRAVISKINKYKIA